MSIFRRSQRVQDNPAAVRVTEARDTRRNGSLSAEDEDDTDGDDDGDNGGGGTLRRLLGWGLLASGVGYGVMVWRDKSAERAPYMLDAEDGAYSIRRYPELVVAETTQPGARSQALDRGYRRLSDYIGAKNRPGDKIAMVAPVLADKADDVAGDQRWRTRFVMPSGWTKDRLPTPSGAVSLNTVDRRRVAVVSFSGNADDQLMTAKERELRNWLERRGETATGEAEYAYYDAPFIPPPLRRNEVVIPIG